MQVAGIGDWRFDAVEEVRSGPSQATRHIAVAGILKILQPLPARDVSKKMFPPATLLKILRIVCARALQNRKLDPGVTEYKFKIGQLVYSIPKGRASYGHRNRTRSKRLPARKDGEFQYQIGSAVEDHNRVARESELTRHG